MQRESKPGYRTTEFWTMLFTNGFLLGDMVGIWDAVLDNVATIAVAIISGLYALERGQAKQGIPYVEPSDRR